MKKIVVVMPVGNEEETIADTISRTMALGIESLVLTPVIDDFSQDGTREIIAGLERKHPSKVSLVDHKSRKGLVTAYLGGFKNALRLGADYVIEMDAGNSHQPEQIPLFLEQLEKGFECVFGSRFMPGGKRVNNPAYRTFISAFGTKVANMYLGTNLTDMTSGFEAFNSGVLARLNMDAFISRGHFYQTEMKYYCRNFKVTEVPIHYTGSSSGLSFKTLVKALDELARLKKNYRTHIHPRLMHHRSL